MLLSSHIDLKSIVLVPRLSVNLTRRIYVLCILRHGLPLTQLPHKPARFILISTTIASPLGTVLAAINFSSAKRGSVHRLSHCWTLVSIQLLTRLIHSELKLFVLLDHLLCVRLSLYSLLKL